MEIVVQRTLHCRHSDAIDKQRKVTQIIIQTVNAVFILYCMYMVEIL